MIPCSMKTLSCGIVVGPNYGNGIAYAVDCMRTALEYSKNKLKFYLCLDPMISNEKTIDIFQKEFPEVDKVFCSINKDEITFEDGHKRRGGIVHGLSLEQLIKSACPSDEYLCIFDSDTCFCRYGWDDFLIEKINSNVIFGANPYIHDKWRGFPFGAFFIFRIKEMQSLDIYCNKYNYPFDLWESQGFGPFDGNVVTVNSENQKFYNVKEGTRIYYDVGAGLLPSVIFSGMNYSVFDSSLDEDSFSFYHYDDGKIFASHMGGSRNNEVNSARWRGWKSRLQEL
jgi:hypothetical protein